MLLNDADYAPFNLHGVGVFMAHSGQGIYRNNGLCGAVKGSGPITGKYWIVDRGTGGFFSGLKAKVQDRWNKVRSGQNLAAMSGLLYTRMTGESMMVPGLITSIGVCFGCIRVRYLKDVSRLPMILITH
jgi:hypothetical protein